MIPQTVLALVGFLFLVAPGLLFEIRRERRRPNLEETAFREASRTALASLFFTVVSLSVLAVVRWIWPWLMPDPGRWLRDPKTYVASHYRVVAGFFLAELVLACALAVGSEWVLGRRQGPTIRSAPIWHRAFRQELPKEKGKKYAPFVGLRLSDGTEFGGFVAGYSTEYKLADRELELAPPLIRRLPDEPSPQELPSDWKRIIIRGPEIRDLWVAYKEVEAPPPRRPSWWRQVLSILPGIDLTAPFA